MDARHLQTVFFILLFACDARIKCITHFDLLLFKISYAQMEKGKSDQKSIKNR